MRQRSFDGGGENPKLRDVDHDEQDESRLGDSRSPLAGEIVNRSRFDLIALHFFVSN